MRRAAPEAMTFIDDILKWFDSTSSELRKKNLFAVRKIIWHFEIWVKYLNMNLSLFAGQRLMFIAKFFSPSFNTQQTALPLHVGPSVRVAQNSHADWGGGLLPTIDPYP